MIKVSSQVTLGSNPSFRIGDASFITQNEGLEANRV